MARLPDDKRGAVIDAIRAGGTCRGIAKQQGVSSSTVARIAKDEGLTDAFAANRTQTAKATTLKRADNAARRSALSVELLDVAEDMLHRMRSPHLVYNFGGADNSYNEHLLDTPPAGDLRNLMVTAATAIDKHVAIEKLDADRDVATAGALLDGLLETLQGKHGTAPAPEDGDGSEAE